ncbi:hypothetical protein [Prosthecomicrobium hirschii]|uniref:hypothetical protein n=1 Tax=Prosthecodimorpha hirschii TaxID=665126 RepID=UPI00221F3D74|nr:hypothetical protein [Prosthecomicrobium hirschii]MCW1844138.1 hypothetical protein [Prosthecomicrobium hirschii]
MIEAIAIPTTRALTVEDINATINHEPRVMDLRLAEALGMARPTNIRQAIEANREELQGFGNLHESRANSEKRSRGRPPAAAYWLTEPQALLLCMFSRTDRAAEVRRMLIEVFMEFRRSGARRGNVIEVKGYERRRPAATKLTTRAEDRAFWHRTIAEAQRRLFSMGEFYPIVVHRDIPDAAGAKSEIDPGRPSLLLPTGAMVIPIRGGGWVYEASRNPVPDYSLVS